MNGFFVTAALTGERHLGSIDNEQEIEGVNQRRFTNVVGPYKLQ
jgi:hypothetical protein